jgi:hypothetical protein
MAYDQFRRVDLETKRWCVCVKAILWTACCCQKQISKNTFAFQNYSEYKDFVDQDEFANQQETFDIVLSELQGPNTTIFNEFLNSR